ncbi:MAG: hypothetical protein E6H46_15755 [Betaproteobacteria bacterium]|nr:MAG: hypothetical protein E6H46_15755 [Betaproteobacteria bacterium]
MSLGRAWRPRARRRASVRKRVCRRGDILRSRLPRCAHRALQPARVPRSARGAARFLRRPARCGFARRRRHRRAA